MDQLTPSDPATIGGHRLLARLGAGGMGRVYLARSPAGSHVALKVIAPELAEHAEFRERFRREVRAAKAVRGPYVAEVVEADPDGDPPWLATRYVAGVSLADAVSTRGPLPPPTVAALGAAVVAALETVARAGLVHRDLKPSNIMLDIDGPWVIDFGIARAAEVTSHLTRTGVLIGTPGYMAPEQIHGTRLSAATDVFALGAVLVFALTGEGPFGRGAPAALIGRILHLEPDLTRVPAEWEDILRRCLAKEPTDRPSLASLREAFALDDTPLATRFGPGWLPGSLREDVQERSLTGTARPAPDPASATVQVSTMVPAPPTDPVSPEVPDGSDGRVRRPFRARRIGSVAAVLILVAAIGIPVRLGQAEQPGATGPGPPGSDTLTDPPASPDINRLLEVYRGDWSGDVRPDGGSESYPVQLTLGVGEVGTVIGQVRYWTLSCKGRLRLEEVASGYVLVSQEAVARSFDQLGDCPELDAALRFTVAADGTLHLQVDRQAGEAPLRSTTANLPSRYTGIWEGTIQNRLLGREHIVRLSILSTMLGDSINNLDGGQGWGCSRPLRLQQVDGEIAWFTVSPFLSEGDCPSHFVVRIRFDSDTEADVEFFEEYSAGSTPMATGQVHLCELSPNRTLEC